MLILNAVGLQIRPSGSSQLDFADIDEFRQAAVDYYSDSRPYSESHYDALGRVTKVDGEGMAMTIMR